MIRQHIRSLTYSDQRSIVSSSTGGVAALGLFLASTPVLGFDSGSTGADGAFAPSVSTSVALPEDGVFNFTTVDIPAGVSVTFEKNSHNTPVVILASGDVNIAGSIGVSGSKSPDVGAAGDGMVGDDGINGKGGPGGYDGGAGGGVYSGSIGGEGLGPGGGSPGIYKYITASSRNLFGGGGGGFATKGGDIKVVNTVHVEGGSPYGSSLVLPLIGGSGGGGGYKGSTFRGSGGGGGGGAILIASSGTVNVTGGIYANGGGSGACDGSSCGGTGGGGSGGAIRIVATTLTGDGAISALGGAAGEMLGNGGDFIARQGGNGAIGRIRLEADSLQRTAATTPSYSAGLPGDLYVAGLPTLRISRVAGVDAPLNPTGIGDIRLPADIPNPVTVEFEATGIPLGNVVELKLTPASGTSVSVISDALDGNVNLSTASASMDLPQGPSTLLASITYTLVATLSAGLERFAGEPVQSMRVEATSTGETRYVLVTESGREIPISKDQLEASG